MGTVAHNAPYGYAASGIYAADSVGAIHTAKRSADADAYYGGYGIYLGPQTSGLSTISHAGFPLQGYAQGYGYGFGHYGKRSADADAYYGAYGLGYAGYGHGYAGYGGYYGPHAAPAVAGGVAIRGYGQPATVAHNAPYGYAASGIYAADSVGAIHTAKRSADADAYYGGYGIYLGPQTSGLSSISHAGFPLQGYAPGYGYGFGHYGKRSADADAYYCAYGLGYAGYGHGYAGYYGPHAAPVVAGGVVILGYGQPATVAHNAP